MPFHRGAELAARILAPKNSNVLESKPPSTWSAADEKLLKEVLVCWSPCERLDTEEGIQLAARVPSREISLLPEPDAELVFDAKEADVLRSMALDSAAWRAVNIPWPEWGIQAPSVNRSKALIWLFNACEALGIKAEVVSLAHRVFDAYTMRKHGFRWNKTVEVITALTASIGIAFKLETVEDVCTFGSGMRTRQDVLKQLASNDGVSSKLLQHTEVVILAALEFRVITPSLRDFLVGMLHLGDITGQTEPRGSPVQYGSCKGRFDFRSTWSDGRALVAAPLATLPRFGHLAVYLCDLAVLDVPTSMTFPDPVVAAAALRLALAASAAPPDVERRFAAIFARVLVDDESRMGECCSRMRKLWHDDRAAWEKLDHDAKEQSDWPQCLSPCLEKYASADLEFAIPAVTKAP